MRQAHKIVNDREARILLLNKKKTKNFVAVWFMRRHEAVDWLARMCKSAAVRWKVNHIISCKDNILRVF